MEVAAQSVLFILRRSEDKTAENHSESQDKTKEESKPSESMLPQPFPENFVSKISETSMSFLQEAGNLRNLHTILDVESSSDHVVNWFIKDARFETERRS